MPDVASTAEVVATALQDNHRATPGRYAHPICRAGSLMQTGDLARKVVTENAPPAQNSILHPQAFDRGQ